jgi:integrase
LRVYKRNGSDIWQIELSTPNGKKRFSSKTSLKREAIQIATYQQQVINDSSNYGKSRSMSLFDACAAYLDDQSHKEKATYANAKFNVLHLLDGSIWSPDVPFETLTSRDIIKLQKLKSETLKPASINHITTALTTMRNRADVWEILEPPFKVKKLKTVAKFRHLNDGEEEKLLDAMKEQDLKDLTVFLLDTGMRISEAVATMWTDRTSENGVECLVTYRGKTGIRSLLPITKRLLEVLERREETSISAYVFPHKTKIGAHRTTATKALILAAGRAGLNTPEIVSKLGKFVGHSCRDTYATRLIRAGCTLYEVQTMLGHASPIMTQKYAHLSTGDIGSKVLRALS